MKNMFRELKQKYQENEVVVLRTALLYTVSVAALSLMTVASLEKMLADQDLRAEDIRKMLNIEVILMPKNKDEEPLKLNRVEN